VRLRNIGVVYRKELLDSLRDRRTVVSMVAVPILLMPLLTIGLGLLAATIMGRAMQEVPTVMILGGEDSPRVAAALMLTSVGGGLAAKGSLTRRDGCLLRPTVEYESEYDRSGGYYAGPHVLDRLDHSPCRVPCGSQTVVDGEGLTP